MRNLRAIALLLTPLMGCYAQLENPSVTMTHPLCPAGTDCVPGGSSSLSVIQVSGTNTFVVDFGDQPLLQSSSEIGPATVKTSLILNQALFDMTTSGADFTGVNTIQLLSAPRESTGPGDDPCAPPTSCPILAAYDSSTDGTANQRIVLRGNGSDLISLIDPTTHRLVIEIQASGQAPSPPLWSADVSMDMALTSRADFP
jgi:hypothetical protein